MIAGGKLLQVDLARCDDEVWLALMQSLVLRYGQRCFVTDDPRQPQPMQKIVNLLSQITAIYSALPIAPERPQPRPPAHDTADAEGTRSG